MVVYNHLGRFWTDTDKSLTKSLKKVISQVFAHFSAVDSFDFSASGSQKEYRPRRIYKSVAQTSVCATIDGPPTSKAFRNRRATNVYWLPMDTDIFSHYIPSFGAWNNPLTGFCVLMESLLLCEACASIGRWR